MNIKIILLSNSKHIEYENAVNTYSMGGMFCVRVDENIIHKYPMVNIVRVEFDSN